ncbi:hypothetical protein ABTX60_40700 [Streptomyces sp. NPDC126510]|uniref:hypothetical protein n=1 Tax=Streptomyces sp. NPDC126510 TaxID=3155317 RepID=UPI0033322D9D
MPEARRGWSGLEAALAAASSPLWKQRVRAGRDLASFADVPEAAQVLVGLLLDVEDTAVTRQTAAALARVGTSAAIRLLALAVAEADDNQADWLQTGVHDALMGRDGQPDLAVACAKLTGDPVEAVRRCAAEISKWTQGAW